MRKYEGEPDYAAGEYDDAGFSRRQVLSSAVTWLIVVNIALYLLEVLVVHTPLSAYSEIFRPFVLSLEAVFQHGRVWQLVTYAFLHDTRELLHFLFDILFIYWFGREIERVWGVKRFLAFYLSAAVFAALMLAIAHLVFPTLTGCFGPTGAVMALVMVFGLLWPNRTILFMFVIPMRMWTFVLVVIVMAAVVLLQAERMEQFPLLLGGLLYGYLVVRAAPKLARRFERLQPASNSDRSWLSAEARRSSDARKLDDLLDKVHAKGIGSLTWRERRFMKKMSRRR